jgi:hypothetical protein
VREIVHNPEPEIPQPGIRKIKRLSRQGIPLDRIIQPQRIEENPLFVAVWITQ